MTDALWGRVDDYIVEKLVKEDAALSAALAANGPYLAGATFSVASNEQGALI